MARIRSPGYPSINLSESIDLTRKIFDRNRLNVTDREAAVKDMGYSGLTGHSSKMIADLAHYGLIERSGKGGVRVTETAARILHPRNPQERTQALQEAAYNPGLFDTIRERWPDGIVSENALESYLARNGFASTALQPALRAYVETYAFLQQENAIESHRRSAPIARGSEPESEPTGQHLVPVPPQGLSPVPPAPEPPAPQRSGVQMMAGERVVFVEEGATAQYLKLVASGEIDGDMLEALEDFVKRQKKRLLRGQPLQGVPEAE